MFCTTLPYISDTGCRAGKEFTMIRIDGVNTQHSPHPCKVGGGMAEDDLINIILMHPSPLTEMKKINNCVKMDEQEERVYNL